MTRPIFATLVAICAVAFLVAAPIRADEMFASSTANGYSVDFSDANGLGTHTFTNVNGSNVDLTLTAGDGAGGTPALVNFPFGDMFGPSSNQGSLSVAFGASDTNGFELETQETITFDFSSAVTLTELTLGFAANDPNTTANVGEFEFVNDDGTPTWSGGAATILDVSGDIGAPTFRIFGSDLLNGPITSFDLGVGAGTFSFVDLSFESAATVPEPQSILVWAIIGLAVCFVAWRARKAARHRISRT